MKMPRSEAPQGRGVFRRACALGVERRNEMQQESEMLVARAGGDTRPDQQTKAFFWKKRGAPRGKRQKRRVTVRSPRSLEKAGAPASLAICWVALRFYSV